MQRMQGYKICKFYLLDLKLTLIEIKHNMNAELSI